MQNDCFKPAKGMNTISSYFLATVFLPLMVMMLVFSSCTGIGLDVPPTYRLGEAKMYEIIGKNIKYPASARAENRTGIVYISFRVNINGKVENVVARNRGKNLIEKLVVVGYSQGPKTEKTLDVNDVLKKEAIRAVESLGEFIPAQKDGESVDSVLTIPVEFVLK